MSKILETGSISGFTYEQIQEMHIQMLDAQQPEPPVESEAESDWNLLNSQRDLEIVEYNTEDALKTVICRIKKSRTLNKKCLIVFTYVNHIENDNVKYRTTRGSVRSWSDYGERIIIPRTIDICRVCDTTSAVKK